MGLLLVQKLFILSFLLELESLSLSLLHIGAVGPQLASHVGFLQPPLDYRQWCGSGSRSGGKRTFSEEAEGKLLNLRFPSASTKLETPVKCMFIFYPLNHSFFIGQCGPGRGDPSLKKIFFLDFDIFMGINSTVFVHWFQICIKFYCGRSLSRDIGKKTVKNVP